MTERLPPLALPLLFYIAGVILGDRTGITPEFGLFGLLSLFGLTLLSRRNGGDRLFSIIILVSFMVSGWTSIAISMADIRKQGKGIPEGRLLYTGVAITDLEPYRDGWRFDMETVSFVRNIEDQPSPLRLNLRVKISKATDIEIFEGDRVSVLGRLKPPRNFNTPGSFDMKGWAEREGIDAFMNLRDKDVLFIHGRGRKGKEGIGNLRNRIARFIIAETTPPVRDILLALTLGCGSSIPQNVREDFSKLGISHILAISGLHVGILFLTTNLLLRMLITLLIPLRINLLRYSEILSLIPAITYSALSGFHISTIRALIMLIIHSIGKVYSRRISLLSSLSVTAFLILLPAPEDLFSISFILSFLSVLSIAIISPILMGDLDKEGVPIDKGLVWRAGNFVKGILIASISVNIGLLPLLLSISPGISPLFFLPNIIVIPLLGFVVVPISLISCLSFLSGFPIASPLLKLSGIIVDLTLNSIDLFSNFSSALLLVKKPSILNYCIYYSLLLIFLLFNFFMRRSIRFPNLLLLLVPAFSLFSPNLSIDREAKVYILDVGQGDAAFIEFSGGEKMLIDTGPGSRYFHAGRSVVSPFLRMKGVSKIDYIVVSHFHEDHAGGLTYILKNFDVSELWVSACSMDKGIELKGIKREKCMVRVVERGFSISLKGGEMVEVLHPSSRFCDEYGREEKINGGRRGEDRKENDSSIYLLVDISGVRFLWTGDGESRAEQEVSNKLKDGVDVLKVPHHGSRSSSSLPFLQKTRPVIAIFPTGLENLYHFPSPSILWRYSSIGSWIFRTDLHGTVELTVREGRFDIRTFRQGEGWSRRVRSMESRFIRAENSGLIP